MRPYIKFETTMEYLWMDSLSNIFDFDLQWNNNHKRSEYINLPQIDQSLDKLYNYVICLRGGYPQQRNTFLKKMAMLDPNTKLIDTPIDGFKFTICPMFKTIFTGDFHRYWNPYNMIDTVSYSNFNINQILDIIKTQIHDDEQLRLYNLIIDGNLFQPYLNKMYEHTKAAGRQYFDLYVVDPYMFDYLNTPVQKCYYKVYGWNKRPVPKDLNCYVFDNLKWSTEVNVPTKAIVLEDNINKTLAKLLTGKIEDIKHFMNKPLIDP